jgi:uncharacterized protein YjbI with pentapeptide repeats
LRTFGHDDSGKRDCRNPHAGYAALMIWVDEEIPESELLRRYSCGQRRFCNLEILSDGSEALEGACLDGIEVIDCFVTASFRGASLKRAVINANVKTCDFSDADLTGADFRTSALCAATFVGANMRDADFTGAYFHSYYLKKGELPDW